MFLDLNHPVFRMRQSTVPGVIFLFQMSFLILLRLEIHRIRSAALSIIYMR